VQLWGPSGSVNGNCQLYVRGNQIHGASIDTLAWLEQNSICEYAFFLFLQDLLILLGRPELDSGVGV
jgi:hypothetical protein